MKNPVRTMVMSGVAAALILFNMVSETEAQSQAVLWLEYALLALAVMGFGGSAVAYFSQK